MVYYFQKKIQNVFKLDLNQILINCVEVKKNWSRMIVIAMPSMWHITLKSLIHGIYYVVGTYLMCVRTGKFGKQHYINVGKVMYALYISIIQIKKYVTILWEIKCLFLSTHLGIIFDKIYGLCNTGTSSSFFSLLTVARHLW